MLVPKKAFRNKEPTRRLESGTVALVWEEVKVGWY